MELIADLPVVGGFLAALVSFLVVLGVVVFVHEYGHYIVGRWCGIHAETFSLGFGPKLYGWTDKRGTYWQIAALPLGGYVKFLGDADGSSRADAESMAGMSAADRARSFHGASVGRRSLTVAAGPVANFILSIAVFGGLALWQGVPNEEPVIGHIAELPGEPESALRTGDILRAVEGTPVESLGELYEYAEAMEVPGPIALTVERDGAPLDLTIPHPMPPLVLAIDPLSAAAEAGLEPGDYIRGADGVAFASFTDLRAAVLASDGARMDLEIVRGDQTLTVPIEPRLVESVTPEGEVNRRIMIGILGDRLVDLDTVTPAPWTAVGVGAERVWETITMSLSAIGHIIVGNLGADNLQGPLGIAQVAGAVAEQDVWNLVTLIAVISTAVGMLNLFPIPVLDGGHLLMFGYEALAGRPPADAVLRVAMTIGLSAVLLLMMFATYNDLMRLAS